MNRSFGIRPLSNNICPGDDIQLSFGLYNTANTTSVSSCVAVVDEKYYMAVYDKKMLWRANLYIDEGGVNDWNYKNPWNVPPPEGTFVREWSDATKSWTVNPPPLWWSKEYGYNEWNREWINSVPYDGITFLPVSNGKQTICIDEYTPLRCVRFKNRSQNFIDKKVSYSYPYSWDDGHFDSPFDFKKKLMAEREHTKVYYANMDKSGLKKKETVDYTQLTYKKNEKGETIEVKVENGEIISEEIGAVNGDMLAKWQSTRAPNNIWGRYLHKNFVIGDYLYTTFLPGLGLLQYGSLMNTDNNYCLYFQDDLVKGDLPVVDSSARDADIKKNTKPYPAGTDCIGFAQRAHQYSDHTYEWNDLDKGWAEGGKLSVGGSGRGRMYPRCLLKNGEMDINGSWASDYEVSSFEIFTKDTGKSLGGYLGDELAFPEKIESLKHIVPGDVFYFNYKTNKGLKENHIAIVQDVQYSQDGCVNDILLIEATFGTAYRVQTVSQFVRKVSLKSGTNYDGKEHYHIVRLSKKK